MRSTHCGPAGIGTVSYGDVDPTRQRAAGQTYNSDTPKDEQILAQLEKVAELQALLNSMVEIDVEQTLVRMSELSSKSLRRVREIIETLHELEERTGK
ncbi:hypothetical protein [Nocardia suismassiliense]|uniref:hypothetical protein n=1 Tax=Nocardia suismassiliense TaxID=2077092 RepID=UPI00131F0C3A|nr:hypothetical protein [Nocardia suismassiliense]